MSWSRYSFFLFCLIWAAAVADCAINLDGTQAVDPAGDDDPSPIDDVNTYHPDQHDCPLACTDLSNVHNWITYFSVQRLPKKAAKTDPGFVLLSYDEWYDKNPTAKVWNYNKRYNPNGKTQNGDK